MAAFQFLSLPEEANVSVLMRGYCVCSVLLSVINLLYVNYTNGNVFLGGGSCPSFLVGVTSPGSSNSLLALRASSGNSGQISAVLYTVER